MHSLHPEIHLGTPSLTKRALDIPSVSTGIDQDSERITRLVIFLLGSNRQEIGFVCVCVCVCVCSNVYYIGVFVCVCVRACLCLAILEKHAIDLRPYLSRPHPHFEALNGKNAESFLALPSIKTCPLLKDINEWKLFRFRVRIFK